MDQSPSWAVNSSSANQEIPHILWNPTVHFRSQKCPPLPVPILSRIIPVHASHPTSWKSILILSHLFLGLPSGLFPSGFPTKTLCAPLLSLIRATCPAHHILLDFVTRIMCVEWRQAGVTSPDGESPHRVTRKAPAVSGYGKPVV